MRALVLGGGGVVGVAWETGLVAGLLEGGIDVREADLVVGTSAGSMVGTRIAAGQDLRVAPSREGPNEIPLPAGGPDMETLGKIFEVWSQAPEMTEALCREIGTLARIAKTPDLAPWVAATGGSLGVDDWPDTDLRVTAVDVDTGRFEVHSAKSGAPLKEAVASSCTVPGMFPPVPIDGRHYMDGGVRSGTNADVILDAKPGAALVIAPICSATAAIGAVAERALHDEVAQLRAAGTRVCTILPDEADARTFGGNLMDASRAEACQEAGRQRGLRMATGEAQLWLA